MNLDNVESLLVQIRTASRQGRRADEATALEQMAAIHDRDGFPVAAGYCRDLAAVLRKEIGQ